VRFRIAPTLAALALSVLLGASLVACAPPGASPATGTLDRELEPVAAASPVKTPTPTPTPLVQPGTNHAASAASYAYPAEQVNRWLVQGPAAEDYPTSKIAFLTFDDGPSKDATPAALKALETAGVPATFFVISGAQGVGTGGPELLRREVKEGHAVCVHSYSHDYSYLYPGRHANPDHIVSDLNKALGVLRETLGPEYAPTCFRYPGGHMSWNSMAGADAALAAEGFAWIDWNAMTGDAEGSKGPSTPAEAAGMVQSGIAYAEHPNVVVILMHDTMGKTLSNQALPQVVADLKAQGYSFGVIS